MKQCIMMKVITILNNFCISLTFAQLSQLLFDGLQSLLIGRADTLRIRERGLQVLIQKQRARIGTGAIRLATTVGVHGESEALFGLDPATTIAAGGIDRIAGSCRVTT